MPAAQSMSAMMRARVSRSPSTNQANSADRKSTRLNSSHEWISYAVFCLKKKKKKKKKITFKQTIKNTMNEIIKKHSNYNTLEPVSLFARTPVIDHHTTIYLTNDANGLER